MIGNSDLGLAVLFISVHIYYDNYALAIHIIYLGKIIFYKLDLLSIIPNIGSFDCARSKERTKNKRQTFFFIFTSFYPLAVTGLFIM